MLRRSLFASPSSIQCSFRSGAVAATATLSSPHRGMKIRKENWFQNEVVPHSRRVSWSPQTTTKKQGAFARLSRSNFYDSTPIPFSAEPFTELQIEAHRARNQPDVYIYKYNVSPTHLSLRPEKK